LSIGVVRLRDSVAVRMVMASALLSVLVAAVFALEQLAVSSFRDASRQEARAKDVGRAAVGLEAVVLDLESGLRGYVISGNRRLLGPWRQTRAALPGRVADLEHLVSADPAQLERVRELATEIEAYQRDYALPLIAIAGQDPAAARAPIASAEGETRIESIRRRFTRLLALEDARAAASTASANSRSQRAHALGIGGLAFSAALVLVLGFYLAQSIGRPLRAMAAAAAELAAGKLSVRITGSGPGEVGELTGAFNSMADSLERDRRALETQNELLLEQSRLKSELVSIVSHELRTPLTSIIGFTNVLLNRPLDQAARQRYLEIIEEQARRLASMTEDFLDLQRIEEGRLELRQELIDLVALLREQEQLFAAQSTRHTLKFELPPDRPLPVRGDPERLTQVLGNLISNAIKYSPAGGEVELAGEGSGDVVRVRVRDHGIGIPADQQPRIFTKFFRGDAPTRGISGTGLGLALAREIIEAHGGRIGFNSAANQGSTFWIELPAAAKYAGAQG
jgi:signal transduction histidine kinase